MPDTTHNFAVGVVQHSRGGMVAFCSGVMLAPNLVATARHCVSRLASSQIDCATSAFAATLPATDIFVVADPTISQATTPYTVSNIIVPSASGVCGNDIALLILSQTVQLPQYATPTINPPMTDHRTYMPFVTAIGYGIDTPTDTNGTSAGVRRIKGNIRIDCIPNDKSQIVADCFSDPNAAQFLAANEFEGGSGTCEGDSGSGAYDQGNFDNGKWVAFGVLSRGGASVDGGSCLGSIYSRFDAWAQFLIDGANQAAVAGGYGPPSWAAPSPAQPPLADAGAGSTGASCVHNGITCLADGDCCSADCVSHDQGKTYSCAACNAYDTCNAGYGCQGGICVAGAPNVFTTPAGADGGSGGVGSQTVRAGGCAVAPYGSAVPVSWWALLVAFGCARLAWLRRAARGAHVRLSEFGQFPSRRR
jgi:hypothetical protein